MTAQKETTITSEEFNHHINRNSFGMKVTQITKNAYSLESTHEAYEEEVEVRIIVHFSTISNRVNVEAGNTSLEEYETLSPEKSVNRIRSFGWQLEQTGSQMSKIWNLISACETMKSCGVDLLAID